MALSLTPIDASGRDRADLTAFLTANAFPFHVRARPTMAEVERALDDGSWGNNETESFWLDDDEQGRVGLVRVDDLADATAMVDLRLGEAWRGRGLGAPALALAGSHVFSTRPNVIRLEGQTREDNHAMLRVFERAGWVREAYYRDGWPVDGAEPVASIAYSVLRRDQASGRTTPVPPGPGAAVTADALVAAAWAAEELLLDPAVRRIPAAVGRLLDDGFVEIGQSGRRWTKADVIAALSGDPGDAPGTVTERSSRIISSDTVLVEYVLRFDGRVSRRCALWTFSPDPRCIFHQGTTIR